MGEAIRGANYGAAKMGLLGLSRSLAIEGEEFGIRSNCVLPFAKAKTPHGVRPSDDVMEEFTRTRLKSGGHPPGALPELVVPMPTYLASRDCAVNGEVFEAGSGYYARVFIGSAKGWLSGPEDMPTADDVAAHLPQVNDLTSYQVSPNMYEQIRSVAQQIADRDGVSIDDL